MIQAGTTLRIPVLMSEKSQSIHERTCSKSSFIAPWHGYVGASNQRLIGVATIYFKSS